MREYGAWVGILLWSLYPDFVDCTETSSRLIPALACILAVFAISTLFS